METNKILSFEEFSTRGTDTATVDAPTVDTATVDTAPDAETTTDTETTDSEETEEETTDAEETKEESVHTHSHSAAESVQVNEEEEEVHTTTVAEMYEKACTLLQDEAKAYENDDYEEHTKGTYMTETANLVAEGHCNAVKEMYTTSEGTCSTEQFEAACNEIKEAYVKKCNEMIEAYGTSENERPESENEPVQGPADSIITKTEA